MTVSRTLERPSLQRTLSLTDSTDSATRRTLDVWHYAARGNQFVGPLAVGCAAALATAAVPALAAPRNWITNGSTLPPLAAALLSPSGMVGCLGVWLGASAFQTRRRTTLLMAPQLRQKIQRDNVRIYACQLAVACMMGTQVLVFLLKIDRKYVHWMLSDRHFNDLTPKAQSVLVDNEMPGHTLAEKYQALEILRRENSALQYTMPLDKIVINLASAPACVAAVAVVAKVSSTLRNWLRSWMTKSTIKSSPVDPAPARRAPYTAAVQEIAPAPGADKKDMTLLSGELGDTLADLRGLDACAKTPPRQEVHLLQLIREIKELSEDDLERLHSSPPPQAPQLLERGLTYVRRRVQYKNQGGLAKSAAQVHLGAILEAWLKRAQSTPVLA